MTDPALIERITRSLAFMLRHQPETFDLELDPFGFADIDDVVHALNERLGEPVEEEDVREAVSSGDRPRYEIQGERIRALYGHSIPVEPGPSSKPPEYLFVAVPEHELERARRFGLRGGRRRFLHLALSKEDAAESGRRSSRDYTVLVIHALDAWEEGISFYDRVALWLAEEVPTHLIEVEGTYHDGTEPVQRRFDGGRERGSERERGHERHAHGRGGGHERGGHGRRGRGGRGRDRERHHGRGDGRGAPERGYEPRAEPAGEPSPEPYAQEGGERERHAAGRFEREPGHGGREARPAREPQGQPAFASERSPERGDGRHEGRREGRRDERPGEHRERHGEHGSRERHESRGQRGEGRDSRPERHSGPARERRDERPPRGDHVREDSREPRRERPAVPSRSSSSADRGSGFGAGLESQEESGERVQRSAPPPSAPPRKSPPAPAKNDGPGFGAGL